MVFFGEMSNPALDDEFIYINKDQKHEDDEMQMLTPILLESMLDMRVPEDVFRIVKDSDKDDDATEVTTESFNDILLPTLDTPRTPPSIMMTRSYYQDDDASAMSEGSFYFGEQLMTSHNVISSTNNSACLIQIPSDIRYDGEVSFTAPRTPKTIHLQPRESAHSPNIFAPMSDADFSYYGQFSLADSISSCGDGNGAEECKYDEDEPEPIYDEGFAYVHGDRFKEDEYWGDYGGHYGSRDFDQELTRDYAWDHASVQGASVDGTQKQSSHAHCGAPSHERSILDQVQDMFSLFFSCDGSYPTSAR